MTRNPTIRCALLLAAVCGACAHSEPKPPDAGPELVPLVDLTPPTPDPDPVEPPPDEPVLESIAPPMVALVLGGGGARGFAHVGVLRVLEQEKIPIDLIVGTSVGSLIGAIYAGNPNTFELEWTAFKLEEDDILDYSLFAAKTGPVKGDALAEFVRNNVKVSRIEQLAIPFVAIATDLNTGERVELDHGPIDDAVRASASIPGVFTPAEIGGRTLVDGGVVANIGVDTARARGADIVIAVNITEEVADDDVTNVVAITIQSINIMMAQMAAVQLQDADVVITPSLAGVGTLDFTQKKRCVAAGIDATTAITRSLRAVMRAYYKERNGIIPPQFIEAT